ncbi:seven-hairpin glycosidase [Thozetella sp. PMI_491]|nr:seven-hairpin glycosidase [Thozetella sp. PMI_491]
MAAARRSRTRLIFAVFLVVLLYTLVQRFGDGDASALLRSGSNGAALAFVRSTFDWGALSRAHPVDKIEPLPRGKAEALPRVQFDFPKVPVTNVTKTEARQTAVREAFLRCWQSYREHAWLHDELSPVTGGYNDKFGGWAATIVDSLDTLWIMGLKDEFYLAAAEAGRMDWNKTTAYEINLFETTIRHLGGLLSAYDLSQERALLAKARELGDMIYMGFDTPNQMPVFTFNFQNAMAGLLVPESQAPSAVPASLALELTRLSQLTGDNKYYDAIYRVKAWYEEEQELTRLPGMWPKTVDVKGKKMDGDEFCIGSNADSLFEYLSKMHALIGGRDPSYRKMHLRAMETALSNIIFRPMMPNNEDILVAGTAFAGKNGATLVPEGQHLVCFAGGMFALGGKLFGEDKHVDIGERLARGCGWAYKSMPSGVMPERFRMLPCGKKASLEGCEWDEKKWSKDADKTLPKGYWDIQESQYILRPEAIESIFILYRITGKEDLRDLAWEMFQGIMHITKTGLANSAVSDVTSTNGGMQQNSMESFWMSETLKYFYLIFSPPDLISLDNFVFNTEAHPLRYSTR